MISHIIKYNVFNTYQEKMASGQEEKTLTAGRVGAGPGPQLVATILLKTQSN